MLFTRFFVHQKSRKIKFFNLNSTYLNLLWELTFFKKKLDFFKMWAKMFDIFS